MKKLMRQEDIKHVEDRVRLFEQRTGCELMLVVASESDEYPGATWRFGVISAFVLTFLFSLFFEFHHTTFWPLLFLISTVAMVFIGRFPWSKKLALSDRETDRETFEKAVEIFHTRGTSNVGHKVTAMIMASLLERKITILIDEKLKEQITPQELEQLVHLMKPHFKNGDMGSGFIQSINALEEKILKDFGGMVTDNSPSELKDQILFL